MSGTPAVRHSSNDYATKIEAVEELYTSLNGRAHPLSSIRSGVSRSDRPELSSVFPASLIASCSDYTDWDDLAARAPWDLTTRGDIQEVPKAELDTFVAAETSFDSLGEMIDQAATYHLEANAEGGESK